MRKLGIVGWRGMVGSVLIKRMQDNDDFAKVNTTLFTTSQLGQVAPQVQNEQSLLQDAYDIDVLAEMDIIITCQGSEYSQHVLPQLRKVGWQGYWIDAASHYRMDEHSIIILDPINASMIKQSLDRGIKNFIGGNCTVSLLMLALHGLLREDLIKWISVMSYQAVSGAGAKAMQELLAQTKFLQNNDLNSGDILVDESYMCQRSQQSHFPCSAFMAPMAFNVLPWIDSAMENGQTKEEWKAQVELNNILATSQTPVIVDGICVRVPTLRAHSQAVTIELKQDISIDQVAKRIKSANEWLRYVENVPEQTASQLTPLSVSGCLDIAVGRLKQSNISTRHINLFTVGDQLLWGAAEPLRRMFNICLDA